jgi:hypothetical protein
MHDSEARFRSQLCNKFASRFRRRSMTWCYEGKNWLRCQQRRAAPEWWRGTWVPLQCASMNEQTNRYHAVFVNVHHLALCSSLPAASIKAWRMLSCIVLFLANWEKSLSPPARWKADPQARLGGELLSPSPQVGQHTPTGITPLPAWPSPFPLGRNAEYVLPPWYSLHSPC